MIAALITTIIIIVTSVQLSRMFSTSVNELKSTNEYIDYILTDQVIISYGSSYFCQGLTANSTSQPISQSSATLFLLSSRPDLLTDAEQFDLSESITLNELTTDTDISYNAATWKFYLNDGSDVSLDNCFDDIEFGEYAEFFLIKGTKAHKKWVNNPRETYAVYYKNLTSKCQTMVYHVQEDDIYFFSFYTDYLLTVTLNIDFHFNRAVYYISQGSIVQSCSFPLDGYSGCSLSVPMSSGYTTFLSLNTNPPVDYDDGANIKIHCQPRVWFYAVVVVGSVFVVAVTILVLIIMCLVCLAIRKTRRARYSPLTHSRSVNTSNSARYGATSDRNRASS